MENILRKGNLGKYILALMLFASVFVFAGDVVVKEGVIEGEKFKSTGCTATGTKAVAFGDNTEASAPFSTAMGFMTEAIGIASTAMGSMTEAIGIASTAMGYETTADADYSTAMGGSTTASGEYSTAMGGSTTASGDYSTSMGCHTSADGSYGTSMGFYTTANGSYGTSMGFYTTASGFSSTAMGMSTIASGCASTAMGSFTTAGPANYATAIGKGFTNNEQDSFAVGFGQKDFSVESELVTVYEDLYVTDDVSAHTYSEHSTFYDKDIYGTALDYSQDCSNIIKINAVVQKEYDHEADPSFLQKQVTVKDYDKYTEEEVWNEALERNITRRTYQTHQELRSNLSMKVAWLRQCVYELKQENQTLKDEIAQIKTAVGIE